MHAPLRDRCEDGRMTGRREAVGEYIARRRKALDMSQDELANAVRVTRTVVSRWENGRQRPSPEQIEDLCRVLDDDGHLASLGRYDDVDRPPLFDPPIRVGDLLRQIGDALIGFLSTEVTPEVEEPGYGWRHDLEDTTDLPSAWASAHGLRAVELAGRLDRRVNLPKVRETIRRLELPSGGWTAQSISHTARLARPEITAVVAGALQDAGEDESYIVERVRLTADLLDYRAPGAELARPFVLATSLIELSRLDLEDAVGRRLVEALVDLSTVDDGARGWPVFVRESLFGPRPSSTVHTAMAVCAITAWARRLDDASLVEVARSGSLWLERHADLDLADEIVWIARDDGDGERLPIRHFTPAWVARAVLATGGDSSSALVHHSMRGVLRCHISEVRIWQWPRSGLEYPVWMTCDGVSALRAWAAAHLLD
jgi:transcriptional regulator with XRE-family HTH domain